MCTEYNIAEAMLTERLSIRLLTLNDAEFMIELVNSEDWIKFIGNRNLHTQADAANYILKIINNQNTTYWTVYKKNNKIPIGIITFIQRDYLNFPDIGFAFLPEYFGKGFAFEATNAVLNSLRQKNSIEAILATTTPENTRSIKLLEKLGLHFDRQIEVDEQEILVYIAN